MQAFRFLQKGQCCSRQSGLPWWRSKSPFSCPHFMGPAPLCRSPTVCSTLRKAAEGEDAPEQLLQIVRALRGCNAGTKNVCSAGCLRRSRSSVLLPGCSWALCGIHPGRLALGTRSCNSKAEPVNTSYQLRALCMCGALS